jgi:hypothetical protein
MKRAASSKIKLTVYVARHVADQLDLVCKDPTKNKSKFTEKALEQLLDPQRGIGQDATVIRRIDSLSKQVAILDRHQDVVLESLGLLIRYFLTVTPPLPRGEQETARAKGHQRFDGFITQLGKRLAGSHSLVSEAMEKVSAHDPDLLLGEIDDPAFETTSVSTSQSSPTTSSSSGPAGPGRGGEAPAQQGTRAAFRPTGAAPGASAHKSNVQSGDDHA